MPCPKKRVPFLIAICVGAYLPLLPAQDTPQVEPDTIPACVSVADDADGDGTGVTPHLFGEHSCIVTEQTTQHPLQVSLGGQVTRYTLQRNNWNPSQDLFNREIECTNYTWNSTSGSFDVEDSFTITHYPVAGDAPHLGEYEIRVTVDGEIKIGTGLWRSIDGRYVSTDHTTETGNTLKLHADPWGETITLQNDQSGMRFWNMNSRDPQDNSVIVATAAQECRYTSGDTFEPTGHLEEESTADIIISIGVPTPIVRYPSSVPEIINPQTGSLVPLEPLYFKLQRELMQQQMWCTDYTWQDDAFIPVSTKPDGYLFMPPQRGEDRGKLYVDYQQSGTLEVYEWWTEDTVLNTTSGFVAETWQEWPPTTQAEFKLWHPDTSPATYTQCVLDDAPVTATLAVELSEFSATPNTGLTEETDPPIDTVTEETDTPVDIAPEETGTSIDEVPEQQEVTIDELPEQTDVLIDEATEQTTNEGDAQPTENSTATDNAPAPAGNNTDSIIETAQSEVTSVPEAIHVSGGGSVSLLMILLLAGVRRFSRSRRTLPIASTNVIQGRVIASRRSLF